MFLVRKSWKNY